MSIDHHICVDHHVLYMESSVLIKSFLFWGIFVSPFLSFQIRSTMLLVARLVSSKVIAPEAQGKVRCVRRLRFCMATKPTEEKFPSCSFIVLILINVYLYFICV